MSCLSGIRVLELAGLAPGPFAGLMLADYGASVLRVDRPNPPSAPSPDVLVRGKSSITIDLKSVAGHQFFLNLVANVDVLIDPFRPGVLEKLGLDPATLLQLSPRLIIARLTGFRRDGKYAAMAGHDINYLAVSGVLSMLGSASSPPSPPGNVLGDFAGGGHMCFTGILLALLHRTQTGRGQVVENNMVDGVSYLATAQRQAQKIPGQLDRPRGENLIDGGCPYYTVYECKDGGYMSVGALEPQFFAAFSNGMGLIGDWQDRSRWPELRSILERKFRTKTRKEWEGIFDGTDACCLPVLSHDELEGEGHEHRAAISLSACPTAGHDDWQVRELKRGEGGEDVIHKWLGWESGRDSITSKRGLILQRISKL